MRKEKPTGHEISEKRKLAKLVTENSFEAEREGKKIKFSPAELPTIKSIDEIEDGQFIGVLENDIESDKLPKGKFNVFIAKVQEKWEGYLESDGKIIKNAYKVSMKRHYFGERKVKKPRFKFIEGSLVFCWRQCVVWVLIWCIVSIRICIELF